jgi:4-hydroxy-2-oxoheptanedioate aldolase
MAWSQSRILCPRSVFLRVLHDDVCLLLQVETRTALSNLEAIAEIDGVDGIFIGPNDLAADMGHLGNWQHPKCGK